MDGKNAGMLLPFLFLNQSGSDENLSSEEKGHRRITDNNGDIEAGNVVKDEHDSDSEDSQPDEETKMLGSEEPHERSKSKTSNKSARSYSHESGRRSREGRKSKYLVQDETVLKHLLQHESNNVKIKNESEKENYRKVAIGDLASSLTSYCPELSRIMPSENQTNTTNSTNAREMATQTSLPLDLLEMEELKQSIEEIISSRNCSSKGTQISPQLNKGQNRKADVKNASTSPVPAPRPSREGRRSERKNNQKNI